MSMSKMMEIATRYANAEEEDCLHSGKGKAVYGDANSNRKQKQKVERTLPAEASALGREALVVDLVVEGVRICKVLMDGGSGLNIMYTDILKGMGIPMSKLSESNMKFHGVIPGMKAKSLG
ncbi:hypothetical protein ZWY2020_013998 [Hordeum vulgare]|nr:hypothetical protein ZWY2020_013998 [Hordeum vulgare]